MPVAVDRPNRQAVSLSTGSHSIVAARPFAPGADHLFGERQVDPADPAVPPGVVDLRRRALRLARKRRAHRLHQRRTPGSYLRMPSSIGHSAAGSALASALCTPTWTILGVKRSVSTPATSMRAASASPSRSSSQARSATQSTGLTPRGARTLASKRVAQRDMRPARRDRRIHPPHQGRQESAARVAPRHRRRGPRRPGRARRRPKGRAAPSPDIRPAAAAASRLSRR